MQVSQIKAATINTNAKKASISVEALRCTVEDFPAQCRYPHTEHFYLESGFQLVNGMQGLLRVYPRGHSSDDKNWLTLYIGLESKPDVEVYSRLEVRILTVEGNCAITALTQQYQLIFSPDFMWATANVAPVEVVLDSMQGLLLPNGGLHIGIILTTHLTLSRRLSTALDQSLMKKLKKALRHDNRKEDHDITFMVGLSYYLAHRAVLVSSPTFRSLFNDMYDPSETFIRLPCVKPKSFEELLIDCYATSNRFCKKCFSYRISGDAVCCEILSWRR
ncbi:unnamed protein product [Hermetia illucens]|uniref:BTB domain-containing protein n=1 Tax=Hermetia illucens TaxID=343691 RepID=A0A7R8UKZ1_HERIL|nr:unnamed protein product [Hermetia illucens]